MAELADAPDLGSGVSRREGSSPFRRTIKIKYPADTQRDIFFVWYLTLTLFLIVYDILWHKKDILRHGIAHRELKGWAMGPFQTLDLESFEEALQTLSEEKSAFICL